MGQKAYFEHIIGERPKNLGDIELLLGKTQDSEGWPLGWEFITQINRAKTAFEDAVLRPGYQPKTLALCSSPAVYTSFARAEFLHLIGIRERSNIAESVVSVAHEGIHSLAYANTPILQASPFRYGVDYDGPKIVLAPRDWMQMVLATEADAYTKQAWIANRASRVPDMEHDFHAATQTDPISIAEFERIRADTTDLKSTLVGAANYAMNKRHHFDDDGRIVTFHEYYLGNALSIYEGNNLLKNPEDVIFVRMDADDRIRAGNTIAPNILDDERIDIIREPWRAMTPELSARLANMEEGLDIHEHAKLPLFKDVLFANGLRPDDFPELAKSAGRLREAPSSPLPQTHAPASPPAPAYASFA